METCRLRGTCNGNCAFCGRACNGDPTSNAEFITGERVQVFSESMICEETEMLQRINALREHRNINEADIKPQVIVITKEQIDQVLNGNNVVIVDNKFVIAIGEVHTKKKEQYTVDRTEKKEEPAPEVSETEAKIEEAPKSESEHHFCGKGQTEDDEMREGTDEDNEQEVFTELPCPCGDKIQEEINDMAEPEPPFVDPESDVSNSLEKKKPLVLDSFTYTGPELKVTMDTPESEGAADTETENPIPHDTEEASYKCDCGRIRGHINIGLMCPHCNTECRLQ